MPFVPFHLYFPDFAKKETGTLFVPPATIARLPAGNYGFIELYCDEPGCDCRRVFFHVISERRKKIEAVIAWGWEDLDFYAKWMRKPGDGVGADALAARAECSAAGRRI